MSELLIFRLGVLFESRHFSALSPPKNQSTSSPSLMEKWGDVLQSSEPVPLRSAPDSSPLFTRWSATGIQRPTTFCFSGEDATTFDRWAGVLSDDVLAVREMAAKQDAKKNASIAHSPRLGASPMCVSTPNLAALIKDDNFELPKATLMRDTLLAYDMR